MKLPEPGILVSGVAHAAVLVVALVAFDTARELDDVHEAVPVETISDTDFNQIMKGDKTAKQVSEKPSLKAEKVADTVETKPDPPLPPRAHDVAAAPPPPAERPDPSTAAPETPPPPAPEPPPRPAEAVPPPPTPVPPPVPLPPQHVDAKAEPLAPAPVPPPRPVTPPRPPEVKPPPLPPEPPKHVEARAPAPKPRPPDKPKLEQLARLPDRVPVEQAQPVEHPPVHKPPPRPKPPVAQPEASTFDPTDISRLLSKDAPTQTASIGPQISRASTAGTASGRAAKMAPNLWDALDGLLEDQYKQCWSYLGTTENAKYIPQIKVMYAADGALAREPVLVNPPADPAMRSLAESALRAVRKCNPLRIPAQFAPYFDEWRGRVLRFDPVDMAG